MTQKTINLGTADQGNGDPLRVAFGKVNDNFTELYTALGLIDNSLNLGAFEFTGSVMTTTDSSAIVIDQATTITSNLSVGGDIVPQTANGGDLGSSTLPWRSLYVSNNTIYIGGTAVGLDANGNLTTGGTVVGSTPAWANITGKPTFATVATTGAYADLTGKPTIPTLVSQLSNDSGFLTSVGNISNIQSEGNINIDINLSDSTLRRWQFGEDGSLTLPSVGKINNGAHDWTFGTNGGLTLPAGGTIAEGGGISGAIRLTPAGGANEYQALLIYPTAGDGNHIHLTAGGGTTELYLGNDTHYVKLGKGAGYNGTIVIAATGLPNTVAGIISSGNWAVVPLSNLATTGGTGTGLTVTVTQVAGVATAIAIVSGPMEGYTANDTITVTSGAATATFDISVLAPLWVFAPDGNLYIPSGKTILDYQSGDDIRSIPGPYADDAAAAGAGVAVGYPYHKTGTSGQVFVRLA